MTLVAPPAHTQVIDPSEIQFRRDTISAGARLAYLIFAAGIIYVAATWEEPNRELMAALFAALSLGGLIFSRLPIERILRGRLREPVFLAWSIFSVAIIGGVVAADGGVDSPLMVLFLLPVVFAALSYPLPSVAAIGALSELTLVGVGTMVGEPDPSRLSIFATSLGRRRGAVRLAGRACRQAAPRAGDGFARRPADRLPQPARIRGAARGRAR